MKVRKCPFCGSTITIDDNKKVTVQVVVKYPAQTITCMECKKFIEENTRR